MREGLPALTSLRFFAAAAIVIGHSHEMFGSLGLATTIPLNQAVSFFFVLSGFVLAYNYRSFDRAGSIPNFYIARFARVWPAHAVATLAYIAVWPGVLSMTIEAPHGLLIISSYLLLLQSWFLDFGFALSLNGVAWSISNELFFYLLFPFLVLFGQFRLVIFVGIAAFLAYILFMGSLYGVRPGPPIPDGPHQLTLHSLIYTNPSARILEFFVGMLAASYADAGNRVSIKRRTTFQIAALLAAAMFLVAIPHLAVNPQIGAAIGQSANYWLLNCGGVVVFAPLITVMAWQGRVSSALDRASLKFLGEISYAIYLLHPALIIAFQKWDAVRAWPIAAQVGLFWASLLFVASASYLLVEQPARHLIRGAARRNPVTLPQV